VITLRDSFVWRRIFYAIAFYKFVSSQYGPEQSAKLAAAYADAMLKEMEGA